MESPLWCGGLTFPFGFSKLKKVSNFLKKLKINFFKGSFKDSLFYFLIISLILFILLIFLPSKFPNQVKIFPKSQGNSQVLFLSSTGNSFPESPDFSLIQGNSLIAITPPVMVKPQVFGTLTEGEETEIRKEILEYEVQPGDTLWQIAENFNISLDTLLWANNLNQNSRISPGQKLIILPVSGVIHQVKRGETLSGIAKTYKGDVEKIVEFNELSGEGDIFAGDLVIIPNGIMPIPQPLPSEIPLASSYFIFPTKGKITQGLHWYNAIDIANECGTPIFATAQGEVLKVKYGWNQGAGNYLTILHPNGVTTIYGHLNTSFVNPGDKVSQGQIIALMGGQPGTPGAGRSTGCHLHFGVMGAKNPFAK